MKRIAPAVLLSLLLCGGSAAAQDQAAQADALFREAKQLIDKRRFDEACPKLEESQRLDPAGGTALTLALCYQAQRRLATAHKEFGNALGFAERDARADRIRVARDAIAKLEPLLSRLTVRVDPKTAALDGLRIERDGERLDPEAFDKAVPVDGGPHTVTVSAPGYIPLSMRVTVREQQDAQTADVPALEPLPAARVEPAEPSPPPKRTQPAAAPDRGGSSTVRTAITVALAGLAVAGAASTVYFGLQARSANGDANERCPSSPCSDPTGVELNEDARRDAWIATASAGVAIAGAAAFTVMMLTRPKAPPTSAAWTWRYGGAALSLGRVF